MSQDINSIIKQLAEIDSASAKILQKTQEFDWGGRLRKGIGGLRLHCLVNLHLMFQSLHQQKVCLFLFHLPQSTVSHTL